MFFKQSDIVKKAQSLIASKVDSARVSWWVNADNEKHTQNYLRADSVVDPTTAAGFQTRFVTNYVPELHSEGYTKYQSINKLAAYMLL